MKATILGLVVSTAAFGATTVYFWQQFSATRAQAEQVAEANRRLRARVAEPEQAREQFMSRQLGGPGSTNPFITGVISNDASRPVSVTSASSSQSGAKDGAPAKEGVQFAVTNPAQMPPSMVRMMRNQMRAQNEKTYFDLENRLGLSQEDADKLLDLITEQQTSSFNRPREHADPAQAEAMRNDWQRIEGEISNLLGPAKAAEFGEYKQEMPARMEVASLAHQFESSDAPLSDQQRTRLISAISEERGIVPMPSFSPGAAPEQYREDYDAWQSDYEQRASERARSILTPAQLTVYEEYQQFQKDMRAQMAAQGRMRPGPGMMLDPSGMRMRLLPPPLPQAPAN